MALSGALGVNPKTLAKWRKSQVTEGYWRAENPRSMTQIQTGEAMVVAFRRHGLPSLDYCPSSLQESIPHPARLALSCCLQRHGMARAP